MEIIVKYYFDEISQKYDLKPETMGASGIDLRSNYNYVIPPNGIQLVKTNLHVQIPEGYEIQIRSRSGLALKHGIMVLNSPGTIDSDYTGNIGVILFNTSGLLYHVNVGDRIAQMVVSRTYTQDTVFVEVDRKDIGETERGSGGFGSTGK